MSETDMPETFEAFMARALHDPREGYYARRISAVGRRGDFTTAPMLGDALGRAIAQWAAEAMRATGCRDLVEVGAGEGVLARTVLRHLPRWTRWWTRMHVVETSAPLEKKQRTLLGGRAKWHISPAEALAACGGRAVIYSNELVDAFPVRVFRREKSGWSELAVAEGANEVWLQGGELPQSAAFAIEHAVGQRVEIHESYARWLADWLPHWKAGRMLTIDYGAEAGRLWQRMPQGTLRAYFHHQRLTGPEVLARPGHQDITADVNFSDLVNWAAPWAKASPLETMAGFLARHGVQDARLAATPGPGDAFMCLEQEPK